MAYDRNKYKIVLFRNGKRVKCFFSSNRLDSVQNKYNELISEKKPKFIVEYLSRKKVRFELGIVTTENVDDDKYLKDDMGRTKTVGVSGDEYYLDEPRFKAYDYNVFYQVAINSSKPSKNGYMSMTKYIQGDCGEDRTKDLGLFLYKKPMRWVDGSMRHVGEGVRQSISDKWHYPSRGNLYLHILNRVCHFVYANKYN